MRILLLVILNLLVSNMARAQYFGEEHWHKGGAIMENGDTIQGLLKYDTDTEILQIKNESVVLQTYSSRKLLAFQFQDQQLGINRLFYIFPFAKVSGYQTPIFFELVERGDLVTLLQREILTIRNTNNRVFSNPMNPIFSPMPIQIRVVEPQFYFFYQSGKIKRFNGSRKNLPLLLPNYNAAMKKFVKDNSYNPKHTEDLIKIIRYYNEIMPR